MVADLEKLDGWKRTEPVEATILFAVIDGKVVVDRDINVLYADNVVGNGVIHVIDGVIIGKAPAATEAPACTSDEQDIMCALESDPQFSTLVALLKTAAFVGELKAAGPFTFFAPTNDAFEAYAAKNGTSVEELNSPKNVEALQQILLLHVKAGSVDMVADLEKLDGWKRDNPEATIFVAVIDGKVVVDRDINVLYADNVVGNGVIHVIDGVIIGKE
jgi:uncharacterized surface protein with fasciclin (FAS1) repeats